ncbi:MAG: Uma2 family endonuclease [Cyanobacteria bacterium]|jgi:Uma2 family endonuclease|nr:Uma2 family endonuclease [Cyanobacteria bacterium GSL.Bin1]
MVTQLTQQGYTPAEYLEFEAEAETRHEFINGEIIPMAGGTTNHNELITNLCVLLKPSLRQQGKRLYSENVRLWIPSPKVFIYPDVMILEGEPAYYGESQTTVTNPVVIFEVLSDYTRDYDQGRKFNFYRSLETLQEYILVDQETTTVMIYRRDTSKNWHLTILDDATEVVKLDSVGVELSLTRIYEGVSL